MSDHQHRPVIHSADDLPAWLSIDDAILFNNCMWISERSDSRLKRDPMLPDVGLGLPGIPFE